LLHRIALKNPALWLCSHSNILVHSCCSRGYAGPLCTGSSRPEPVAVDREAIGAAAGDAGSGLSPVAVLDPWNRSSFPTAKRVGNRRAGHGWAGRPRAFFPERDSCPSIDRNPDTTNQSDPRVWRSLLVATALDQQCKLRKRCTSLPLLRTATGNARGIPRRQNDLSTRHHVVD
jgi:hypothetical protein